MGYDMYWVEVPPEMKAAAEVALKVASNATGEDAKAAWKAYDATQPYYFRLNMWGMGLWVERMAEFGMVVDSKYKQEDWPTAEQFGLTWEQVEAETYDANYERCRPTSPAVIAYVDARDAFLRERFTDQPGIPVHKFGSNDGWVVTPEEIKAALKVAPEAVLVEDSGGPDGARKPLERWLPWLEFLRGAAAHGGMEVN
jgi:hypothetical protein